MPFATSSVLLLLVVMPFATRSVLAPSSDGAPSSDALLFLVVRAPSSILAPSSNALCY